MTHLLLAVIYLAFISLGLPDSLLGSAWPMMHTQMGVNVSWAGIVSVIICCGTVCSSLLSDRLTRKFGTGVVTTVSVFLTAAALLGFSVSTRFWMLCVFAIPYGLGAGSIDAALNNYVVLHYASRHMSWLHCMWGIGASIGPSIMSLCLSAGLGWPAGYQTIGLIQLVLSAIMLVSMPLWRKSADSGSEEPAAPVSLKEVLRMPGVKAMIVAFFCYCGAESTVFLWAGSYMVLNRGVSEETAAIFVAIFYFGMTAGRALNGFLTMRWNNATLIRLGTAIMLLGMLLLLIPSQNILLVLGLGLTGLGFAPVYPCIIHSTPGLFGKEHSHTIIGIQMAGAYLGALLMPPLFGWIADLIHIRLFPVYLLLLSGLMLFFYQKMLRQTAK